MKNKIEPMELAFKALAAEKNPDRLPTEEDEIDDTRLEILKRQVETKSKIQG
jgi:hypothetical protein